MVLSELAKKEVYKQLKVESDDIVSLGVGSLWLIGLSELLLKAS